MIRIEYCNEAWIHFKNQNKNGQRFSYHDQTVSEVLMVQVNPEFVSVDYMIKDQDGKLTSMKSVIFNKSEVHEVSVEGIRKCS